MAILKYLVAGVTMLILSSCYEEFNPDITNEEVLCINSEITAGEEVSVHVSHSWRYNDDSVESLLVKDANITLLVNGQEQTQEYLAKEGDVLNIMAISETYGEAHSEVTIPYGATIGFVKANPVLKNIYEKELHEQKNQIETVVAFDLDIEAEIVDTDTSPNYYMISSSSSCPQSFLNGNNSTGNSPIAIYPGTINTDIDPIFKEHINAFETLFGNDFDISMNFFTDRLFSNSSYILHLRIENAQFSLLGDNLEESLANLEILLHIDSISQSYYNWGLYKWNEEQGLLSYLPELGLGNAIWGYSNVSTGAGIVRAKSTQTYHITLNDFIKECLAPL